MCNRPSVPCGRRWRLIISADPRLSACSRGVTTLRSGRMRLPPRRSAIDEDGRAAIGRSGDRLKATNQRADRRFVPVESEGMPRTSSVFRVREMLIRQRTPAIDAPCGHPIKYGWVLSHGGCVGPASFCPCRGGQIGHVRHLMTIPGIGSLTTTSAPSPVIFRKSPDFALWLGLWNEVAVISGLPRILTYARERHACLGVYCLDLIVR